MSDDRTAPATKDDIRLLMDQIGNLYDANERWKDEILDANGKWKDEILQHFDVVAENLHVDFVGAHNDHLQGHENRITRLEKKVGLPAM